MKPNNGLNNSKNQPVTTFSSKAAKVQIRKSLSSPTSGPRVLKAPDPTMLPSNSELPKKESITIPPSPNKNNKKENGHHPIRLNTLKNPDINHHLSSATTTSTHERPNLRMSASSRFGKNLLPTWLGGHSTEDGSNSPKSPTTPGSATSTSTIASNDDFDSIGLEKTFETLLVNFTPTHITISSVLTIVIINRMN